MIYDVHLNVHLNDLLVHILVFLTLKVPKWSISFNFSLDGIPDGPYMTDMDKVATQNLYQELFEWTLLPSWGSLIYYFFLKRPFKQFVVQI